MCEREKDLQIVTGIHCSRCNRIYSKQSLYRAYTYIFLVIEREMNKEGGSEKEREREGLQDIYIYISSRPIYTYRERKIES